MSPTPPLLAGNRSRLQALLRRVRALELVAERNVSSLLSGNYRTTFQGQGLDFREARKYLPGESVRRIDWRMTARMREPYVQVHNEERQREVFVAVDTSGSMATGWQQRNKLETAIEVAATLGLSAVRNGDRLGHVLFAERAGTISRPSSGRLSLFLLLRHLVEAHDSLSGDPWPAAQTGADNGAQNGTGDYSDVRSAIHAIQGFRGRRFVIFLISDFIDTDLGEDFRYLEQRHDTTLVRIEDSLEGTTPPRALRRLVQSPEGESLTGVHEAVDAQAHHAHRAAMDRHAKRRRAFTIDLDTDADIERVLRHGFYRKRLRARRAALR